MPQGPGEAQAPFSRIDETRINKYREAQEKIRAEKAAKNAPKPYAAVHSRGNSPGDGDEQHQVALADPNMRYSSSGPSDLDMGQGSAMGM